uniref:Evasin n=1 Tax=Rhipicephalus zambeziensis TaxID=60191 RepID=A0A224Y3D2_9ACAR
MTTLSLCGTFVLIFSLLQVHPAHGQGTNDCGPMLLQTHGKPIHVGCTTSCESSAHTVTARQSGQECTNISTAVAKKMQKFLGYMCPVGWCSTSGICELSGLTVECWNVISTARKPPTSG